MESTFDIENKRFEKKSRNKSLIITLGFHAGILILFAFFAGVNSPIPPFEGGGVEVNFGISDVGSGDMQPLSDQPNLDAPMSHATAKAEPVVDPKPEDDVETQTMEDAPEVKTTKTPVKKHKDLVKPIEEKKVPEIVKPQTEVVKTAPKAPERKVDPRSVYHGPKGKTNGSPGDGTDGVPGDKGKLNGDPGAKGYDGTGGKGKTGPGGEGQGAVRANLSGRKMVHTPTIEDNSQESGTVVIMVTVDNNGNVIKAKFTNIGSTTTDNGLISKSLAAAKTAKFNAADLVEQSGPMYFVFGLK